jgi:hypothetical protein
VLKLTLALPSPGLTKTTRGVPGTASGLTALEAADGALVPAPFVAVTVNV